MKKHLLKNKFIELRVKENTFDEIAKELKISKPTAIKWAKEFKKEIELERLNNYSKKLIGIIIENEHTIEVHTEIMKRDRIELKNILGMENHNQQVLKSFSNIFHKRLSSIELRFDKRTNKISKAVLKFHRNEKEF
ncbi:MAG: hypothetical protein K9H48_18330 [Melioribacteraceae bacterium]|nr:hypothetical protein [Saprospiraceae bacterium]MCF8356410.1 hypothetical protein [Melioribacteraceae bacterium]MCF8396397.1 hypothetical protein [Melioribacteraceae bacterium]